jgi:FkbM family methyltransferase
MSMRQKVSMFDRELAFDGDEGDFYFDNLAEFAKGHGEKQLAQFASRHLRDAKTCLDIGANIGLTTAILALACPLSHVYAFEPSPKNAGHLRKNTMTNNLSNTSVYECALGAMPGTTFVTMPSVGANSTIVRDSAAQIVSDRVAEVAIDTVDEWSKRTSAHVDFIKLDVEGYEADVLAGAASTLARDRPLIFMEFNSVTISFEARCSPLVFAETIWELFDVWKVDDGGELSALEIRSFVLDNMVRHGCVDDVILRPKSDKDASSIKRALSI